jgi:hypothetical protein
MYPISIIRLAASGVVTSTIIDEYTFFASIAFLGQAIHTILASRWIALFSSIAFSIASF